MTSGTVSRHERKRTCEQQKLPEWSSLLLEEYLEVSEHAVHRDFYLSEADKVNLGRRLTFT